MDKKMIDMTGCWNIEPAYLETVMRNVNDMDIDAAQFQEIEARDITKPVVVGKVAVIDIKGPLWDRDNILARWFGNSYEAIEAQLINAVNSKKVRKIVFDIDSGGGEASGMDELATVIRDVGIQKNTASFVRGMMASAAYGLGSAANEIIATPTSEIGSIGTVLVHQDISGMLEQDGVKLTVIKAGQYKWEGNAYEPLGEEAKEYFQDQVNKYYSRFVSTVAANRGVTRAEVTENYGQGRMMIATDALASAMIDRTGKMIDAMRVNATAINKQNHNNRALEIKKKRAAAL